MATCAILGIEQVHAPSERRIFLLTRRVSRVFLFLIVVLSVFTEVHQLGVALSAPFQMKTGSELPGREPDLL